MKASGVLRLCFVLVLFSRLLFSQSTDARAELDTGIEAYKVFKFEEAAQHFKKAILLDEQFLNAHLYLATVEAQQYIPGVSAPENKSYALIAIEEYKKVLELDPSSKESAKTIAQLYLQMEQFDNSREYFQRAIDIDSGEPENYYSIGVINWNLSYKTRMELRKREKLAPEQALIYNQHCPELRATNEKMIQSGIDMLAKSLQLRPDYDDAMVYMNLLYRERADIDCSDPAAYKADITNADHWIALAISTKKKKGKYQPPSQGSILIIGGEHDSDTETINPSRGLGTTQ